MQRNFTRTAILSMGIAFGFLIGCSSLFPASQDKSSPDDLSKKEVQNELKSLEQQLQNGQEAPALYYRKGYLLNELAQKTDKPAERVSTYREMRTALKKAETLYGRSTVPDGKQKVDEILKVSWSNEHNRGVRIMQGDSLRSRDLDRAAVHFHNATVILPDTSLSYKMEARAYYRNHNYPKAIATLETARGRIESVPASLLEQLAFLYLEDDQTQKAIAVYEEANSFTGENLNLIHGLANAYIKAGNHRKAIDLMQSLVEEKPDNIIYRQTLGNEYYHLASARLDKALSATGEGMTIDARFYSAADSLMSLAKEHYEEALSISSGDAALQQDAAIFYRNGIIYYEQLTSRLPADRQPLAQQKLKELYTSAIPLYENLTDRFPDNKQYWETLYKAYSGLGMTAEAREVKSKFQ